MTTPGDRDLTSAYADLVAGVLDARSDAATQAFDAEIAIAESEGRLDARTARALRWWQRESLRALVEHSRTALPPALAALDHAQIEAARATVDAAQAWERAVGDTSPAKPLANERLELPSLPDQPLSPPADLRERRRRLIVAGLNPLPREE